ncbi:dimethylarginine dimethylaminohydrolase family protein [Balneola vulgaris]|jgi:N-dimethylarginine dimethylaminohydrolase|uniref:dimethylarginine dimethylaminohydrolase family protein n=1 Tax=Balneola vulgaris TaxID=287535 RepID=UPI00035EE327|nr:arginine deiminase-related protein [Balneola vulgaris]
MKKVISTVEELDFELSDLREMPAPKKVLLVKPTHFAVEYVINPHMQGNIGDVDKIAAMDEWEHLKKAYDELGLETKVLDGERGYPDMVFCANQSLPYIDEDGNKKVLMSIMHAQERKGEVEAIQKFYEESQYEIHHLDESKFNDFEGMGDALWHFKKGLIWGGYGFRSSKEVYELISEKYDVPVITFELLDDKFYHLDTCLCILDENTALIYPKAFTDEGLALINKVFPTVIEASKYEAEELFACNATSPDGKNVFIQQGCTDVNQKLRENGFNVHEFSTAEFLKSGGSVFCMKMMLW